LRDFLWTFSYFGGLRSHPARRGCFFTAKFGLLFSYFYFVGSVSQADVVQGSPSKIDKGRGFKDLVWLGFFVDYTVIVLHIHGL